MAGHFRTASHQILKMIDEGGMTSRMIAEAMKVSGKRASDNCHSLKAQGFLVGPKKPGGIWGITSEGKRILERLNQRITPSQVESLSSQAAVRLYAWMGLPTQPYEVVSARVENRLGP